MLAMRGWPVRIEISPKKAPSFRSPTGVLPAGDRVLPERAHAARGEDVEARARLALAQDHLAALEGQELQALDHRHHLVHGEVAEQRAHHDLAPAARRRPRRGGGRRGRVRGIPGRRCPRGPSARPRTALPTSARRPAPSLDDLDRVERHLDFLVVRLAGVQEVVVLDPLVGNRRRDEGRGRDGGAASGVPARRSGDGRGQGDRARGREAGSRGQGSPLDRRRRVHGSGDGRHRLEADLERRFASSGPGAGAPASSIPIIPTDRRQGHGRLALPLLDLAAPGAPRRPCAPGLSSGSS